MPTYELGYNQYKFVIRTSEKTIEVYRGGVREHILNKLPKDITWEYVEKILNKKDHEKEISDLVLKISKFYMESKK